MDSSKSWYRSWPVDLAVRLVYCCGLLHLIGLLRRFLGRRRLIILLYHRLAPPGGNTAIRGLEFDDPVPADRFDGHLRVLRWFGEPLALDQAFAQLHKPASRSRMLIAVTFDDGYRDNYTLGRPIWNRHRVPITMFPAVAPIDRGEWLWWDELQAIVGMAELHEDRVQRFLEVLDELAPGTAWAGNLTAQSAREEFGRFLFGRMVHATVERCDAVLGELAVHFGVSRPSRPAAIGQSPSSSAKADRLYINWDELREMTEEGLHVGGHTVRHPRLPSETAETANHEIADCRAALEERLMKPVICFASPGGFYGSRELDLIAESGYRFAVTVEKGVNYPDTDPYRLRRIVLSWDEPHHLAFKLAFADWLFPTPRKSAQ